MSTYITSTQGWVKVSLLFVMCMMYSALVEAVSSYCASCSLAGICTLHSGTPASSGDNGSVPVAPFQVNDVWTSTATDGFTGSATGTPRTLTWGFVADGTNIAGNIGETASGSDLIARLDGIYGAGPGGADLTLRPWYTHFETSFERWEELSGLTFNYESNDGGAAIDGTTSPAGSLGNYADHRIGGHDIDGNFGVLAYNFFPNHADMVIDTNDSFFNNTGNNSIRLENVLMHEIGHGLGFSHLESNNSGHLMEPFINTSFRGPQHDDILAVHRNYGDALEKNGGNDTAATAFGIGSFAVNDSFAKGIDGADQDAILMSQTDFISIDGSSDDDFFHFTVTEPANVNISVTGVGRTYNEGPQDGTQNPLNTSTLNEVSFEVISGPLGSLSTEGIFIPFAGAANGGSTLLTELVPGTDYYIHVEGSVNNVQFYQLDLSFVAVPEPSAFLLLALGMGIPGLKTRC